MSKYAEGTQVSADKSRTEIERIVSRYGASKFFYAWEEDQAVIGFQISDKMIRLSIPLPDKNSKEFIETPTGRERTANAAYEAYEKETRRRWRSLALLVKAKLEAIELGFSTVEREFMADILLPDGRTVADFMIPQIDKTYLNGKMPKMLAMPMPGKGK